MAEFLWFTGGALVCQILIKILRISQLYMFFQEIHAHSLLMLEAASQDLETAAQLKAELLEDSELEQADISFVRKADEQAIDTWKTTSVVKLQMYVPDAFKQTIKYDSWDEMKKYLRDIIKT